MVPLLAQVKSTQVLKGVYARRSDCRHPSTKTPLTNCPRSHPPGAVSAKTAAKQCHQSDGADGRSRGPHRIASTRCFPSVDECQDPMLVIPPGRSASATGSRHRTTTPECDALCQISSSEPLAQTASVTSTEASNRMSEKRADRPADATNGSFLRAQVTSTSASPRLSRSDNRCGRINSAAVLLSGSGLTGLNWTAVV